MKKIYVAPAQSEVNFQTEGMLAASVGETVRISNSVTDADASMSNSRDEGWNHTWE